MNQIFYLKEGYITPVNLLTTMSEGGGSIIIEKNKFHGSHFSEPFNLYTERVRSRSSITLLNFNAEGISGGFCTIKNSPKCAL